MAYGSCGKLLDLRDLGQLSAAPTGPAAASHLRAKLKRDKASQCYPCLRSEVLPMSSAVHAWALLLSAAALLFSLSLAESFRGVAIRKAPLLASPLIQPSPSQGGGTRPPARDHKLTSMGPGG